MSEARADERRRSLAIAIGGAAGSTVLFLLALGAMSAKPAAKPAPAAASPEPIDRAVELMTQALHETRRRIAEVRTA